MYVPDQFQRSLATHLTPADQRRADEQQGLIVASIAESWRQVAARARGLVPPLPLIFRKDGRPVSLRGRVAGRTAGTGRAHGMR